MSSLTDRGTPGALPGGLQGSGGDYGHRTHPNLRSDSVTHTHSGQDNDSHKPDASQQFNLLHLQDVCVQNFHQKVFIANFYVRSLFYW